MQLPSELPSPNLKNKKIHPPSPPANSLYFQKWNFLALILKNSYIFLKGSFSYISRNGTLYFSTCAQKIKKSTRRKSLMLQDTEALKKVLIFPESELSYILRNGTFESQA